jgi:hypothetical protein
MWLGFGEAIPAAVASVPGGVINAWLFLVNVAG